MLQGLLHHFLKQLLFLGNRLLLRIENFLLLGTQLIGVEALGIGHGLLAHIVLGHKVQVGFGHFNKVSKGSIVFDLEVGNSGLFPLGCLQIENPSFSAAC